LRVGQKVRVGLIGVQEAVVNLVRRRRMSADKLLLSLLLSAWEGA
jgi:hypothetical protein